jgi:inosose dehydratase
MPQERVLGEIAELGLDATELGPLGFLPSDPAALRGLLGRYGLRLVGGFVPAVLHRRDRLDAELSALDRAAALLAAGRADVLVLAAASEDESYEHAPELSEAEWATLVEGLEEAGRVADRHGLVSALHPHYGTVVERADHVDRVLETSRTALCIDTGHLLVGGADPLAVTEAADGRVAHVHLKDVDARVAMQVRAGTIGYRDAVAAGLYRPLGVGDVDVAALVRLLEDRGYDGWYVLEQDTVLSGEPPPDRGPIEAARQSIAFLHERRAGRVQ